MAKMARKLYHYQVGFPEGLVTNFGVVELTYSRHALNAAQDDRYGRANLPRTIDTSRAQAIEVEVTGRQVTKIVYRTFYNGELDLVLVVTRDAFVKTVWFNRRSDTHRTLDRSKYHKPHN